jgi:hypothetical protein
MNYDFSRVRVFSPAMERVFATVAVSIWGFSIVFCLAILMSLAELAMFDWLRQVPWSPLVLLSKHGLAIAIHHGIWWPHVVAAFFMGCFCGVAWHLYHN